MLELKLYTSELITNRSERTAVLDWEMAQINVGKASHPCSSRAAVEERPSPLKMSINLATMGLGRPITSSHAAI